jgi:hypothetical protein
MNRHQPLRLLFLFHRRSRTVELAIASKSTLDLRQKQNRKNRKLKILYKKFKNWPTFFRTNGAPNKIENVKVSEPPKIQGMFVKTNY